MSQDEFWKQDPDLFWAYRFSYINKKKRENELYNNRAWLQGAYFHEAISVALSQAFGKGTLKYTDKPYDIYGTNRKREESPKQNLLEERLKQRAKKIEDLLGGKKNE